MFMVPVSRGAEYYYLLHPIDGVGKLCRILQRSKQSGVENNLSCSPSGIAFAPFVSMEGLNHVQSAIIQLLGKESWTGVCNRLHAKRMRILDSNRRRAQLG